jgi:ribose transport system permease protein
MTDQTRTGTERPHDGFGRQLKRLFVRVGVLPALLIVALIVFTALSDKFLTPSNLISVVRQYVFLIIVSAGQMMVLLTGGFDLSVGTIIALSSVIGATAMAAVATAMPDMIWLAILVGVLAGVGAGLLVGVVNGIGVAVFGVSPFIMTLGVSSIGFGIALFMTGGMPVYGMPIEFGDTFGFGTLLGIPIPIYFAVLIVLLCYGIVSWTRYGRALYAVGGNAKAARLSGIDTRWTLFLVYVLCAGVTAVAGMLLTARMDTGEANSGGDFPLQSIAACVIAGVSLRGGIGRVENVVLGALFIGLIQNGMNLAKIESYLQIVVLGVILILAVVADQLRLRWVADLRA